MALTLPRGLTGAALLLFLFAAPVPLLGQPLPDTLTFERATALLQEHNPQLRAARAQAQAEGRTAHAAALYPNPSLSVSEERTDLSNGVDDQWYTSISQPLRYPGEHGARSRSADATETAARARVEEERTRLFNTLRHRYLDVVASQARVDVLHSFASSVRQAAEAAQVRHEEGDLGTFQRARMQVARAQYENDLADAERRLRDARIELAYLLLPDAQATLDTVTALGDYRVAGTMQFAPVTVDETAALRRALDRRGALQAAQAQVQARTADLDAARYQRYPSLTLSAGPKRQSLPSSTTYGYTAGLSIGLPVWNGGRTAVEAEQGRRTAATAHLEAVRRQVEVQVHDAMERLESYRNRIQTVSENALANTDSLGVDAMFVYRQGEISLFELLDALDAARQARLLRLDLTAGYLRALYDLESAVGIGPTDAPLVVEGALRPRNANLR
jgi:cobalt-zinc-cadmium efflux system outer membrane protein